MNQRKYYLLRGDFSIENVPSYEWINKKEQGGYISLPRASTKPFGDFQFKTTPKIQFINWDGPWVADAYCFSGMNSVWLISDRLKNLWERVDPDPGAFSFIKTEVDYSQIAEPGPDYWLVYFMRELDCVDEEHSDIGYQQSYDPKNLEIMGLPADTPVEKNYLDLEDIRMRPEVVGEAHTFRLKYATQKMLIDDVLLDAMEAERIFGLKCKAVQKS